MARFLITASFLLTLIAPAHAIEVTDLWVPGDPVASEARMLVALETAHRDDVPIIRTQIARTYVFRKDFDTARDILNQIALDIGAAGPEAQARYWLELGRSYASHQHPHDSQTNETRKYARDAYQKALALTTDAGLDALTVDTLHMFAFIETDPAEQLPWIHKALDAVLESDQPAARRWEPSIRNNLGESYFDLAQYARALEEFQRALALRKSDHAPPEVIRDANWHVARALRKLGQLERALEIQQRLADEAYAANEQRHYIHDELSLLYAALGDHERAAHFGEHSAALKH